ncbi:uncharacterized protein B0H18DRAFT_634935 [Fomitopsis serialis]|uniref:uncharacterized protein n=1 Tax=Fomitopsis serialis TaxID=139415 RepID=UPI0020088EFD|nr:uncharacterized protein B0H18DRAFT_634935 [Neoantrodia serialis]KAH9905549.1 hypothetical protein B0H18DRAFT_634935 [Neoantrodia serialis]
MQYPRENTARMISSVWSDLTSRTGCSGHVSSGARSAAGPPRISPIPTPLRHSSSPQICTPSASGSFPSDAVGVNRL